MLEESLEASAPGLSPAVAPGSNSSVSIIHASLEDCNASERDSWLSIRCASAVAWLLPAHVSMHTDSWSPRWPSRGRTRSRSGSPQLWISLAVEATTASSLSTQERRVLGRNVTRIRRNSLRATFSEVNSGTIAAAGE